MSDSSPNKPEPRPEQGLLRPDWDDDWGLPDVQPTASPMAWEDDRADRLAFASGWHLLRQEPGLVGWNLVAQFARGIVEIVPIAFLGFLVLVQWLQPLADMANPTIFAMLSSTIATINWLQEPIVVIGVVGMLLAGVLASWLISLTLESGTYGALRRRVLAGARVIEQPMFWKSAGERFPALLLLGFVRFLSFLAIGAVAVSLTIAAWDLSALWGLSDQPIIAAALMAAPVTICLLIGALAFVWFDLARAEVFAADLGAGEALANAVALAGRRTGQIVRLYLLLALVPLVVLSVYLPFSMIGAWMGDDPQLALAGWLLQTGAETVLVIGMAIAYVWATGAVVTFVSSAHGLVAHVPPSRTIAPKARPAKTVSSTSVPIAPTSAPHAWQLPDRTPNIVKLDDILQRDD